jgi:hypothetical protein
MTALRAPNDWAADAPLGSNSLQHRVQTIAQLDDFGE